MELAKELKDATQEGILQANLGLVYLREGLMSQAENACRLAWKLGKQHQNPDAVEQAEYCLNEIKTTLNGEKRKYLVPCSNNIIQHYIKTFSIHKYTFAGGTKCIFKTHLPRFATLHIFHNFQYHTCKVPAYNSF